MISKRLKLNFTMWGEQNFSLAVAYGKICVDKQDQEKYIKFKVTASCQCFESIKALHFQMILKFLVYRWDFKKTEAGSEKQINLAFCLWTTMPTLRFCAETCLPTLFDLCPESSRKKPGQSKASKATANAVWVGSTFIPERILCLEVISSH